MVVTTTETEERRARGLEIVLHVCVLCENSNKRDTTPLPPIQVLIES